MSARVHVLAENTQEGTPPPAGDGGTIKPGAAVHAVQAVQVEVPVGFAPGQVLGLSVREQVVEVNVPEGAEHGTTLSVNIATAPPAPETFEGRCIVDPRSDSYHKWAAFINGPALVLFLCLLVSGVTSLLVHVCFAALHVFFIADMVVNFHLAYRATNAQGVDVWVVEHSKIAFAYVTGWFLIDFLSILPFDSLGLALDDPTCSTKSARGACISDLKIFNVIRVLRLVVLCRILKIFHWRER